MLTKKLKRLGGKKAGGLRGILKVCKKGDTIPGFPDAAAEDGWLYFEAIDGNEVHRTFRPPTRTKTHAGFDEAWETV